MYSNSHECRINCTILFSLCGIPHILPLTPSTLQPIYPVKPLETLSTPIPPTSYVICPVKYITKINWQVLIFKRFLRTCEMPEESRRCIFSYLPTYLPVNWHKGSYTIVDKLGNGLRCLGMHADSFSRYSSEVNIVWEWAWTWTGKGNVTSSLCPTALPRS